MDELIDKILGMPALTLDESEWNLAIKILGKLQTKSPGAFKTTLDLWMKCNQGLKFDSTRLDNFLDYLSHWNKATSLVIDKIEQIAAVWKNIFFDPLGAEDLVPTLIELINCDDEKLKMLAHKIELALKLDDSSYEACLLTNLQIAITFKIQKTKSASENDKANFEKIHEKVKLVRVYLPTAAEEVQRQLQLRQHGVVCNEYKEELAEKIKAKLIRKNKSLYQPQFDETPDIDHTILTIINANHQLGIQKRKSKDKKVEESASRALVLFNNSAPCEITDGEILLLFNKFKAIFDLYATCSERKKRTSAAKLEEFSEKYILYRDILSADGDTIGTKIVKSLTSLYLFDKLYTLIPQTIRKPTTKERFSQVAGILFSTPRDAGVNVVSHPTPYTNI